MLGSRPAEGLWPRGIGSLEAEEERGPQALPTIQRSFHPKWGTSWPGLKQEEALEACWKTGSDCRKWVPLFSPLPLAWLLLGIAPTPGQLLSLWLLVPPLDPSRSLGPRAWPLGLESQLLWEAAGGLAPSSTFRQGRP